MHTRTLHTALLPMLRPFSRPYGAIMEKRRALYAAGRMERYSPARPTVSLGNIAWGGTGKTPFTEWLLTWAEERGLTAAVLTRGYGGTPGPSPLLVTEDTAPEKCGDEPLLLAKWHPRARILVFPDRKKSARLAEDALAPDLFILDDGMQHLAVARHLDIVLLRPCDLGDQWNRVIPGGSWRENASALGVAGAFGMKIAEEDLPALRPLIEQRLARYGAPFFTFTLRATHLIAVRDGLRAHTPPVPESAWRGGSYVLTCGVGEPAQVAASATAFMGREPAHHFIFPDHHAYTHEDARQMLTPGLPVLCTAKDAVKLHGLLPFFAERPLWALMTSLHFGPTLFTDASFPAWWENWWHSQPKPEFIHDKT